MGSDFLQTPVAKRLEGKVAVITGGASGIGAATASVFVKQGAKVVVADIQDDLGEALVKQLGLEDVITYVHCNVSIESDVQNAVDTAVSKYGKLDIMFSNAGITGRPINSILEVDYDLVKSVFDVNVFGAFFCGKHAARVMIPAKKGAIIFTASVTTAAFGDIPHTYVSSKNAILGLSKNLGVELGQHGIRVNCISPYALATPMGLNSLGIDKQKAIELFKEASNLPGTTMDEDDCAQAALYLASDDSKYVSGHNLIIDGGYSTTNKAFKAAVIKTLFS